MTDREIAEALFELDCSHDLYPDERSELEAVRDGRKGISVNMYGSCQAHCREMQKLAQALGLSCIESEVPNTLEPHVLLIFREDQAWRANAFKLLWPALRAYPRSAAVVHQTSLLWGYTEEQARRWVEFLAHQSASWSGGPTLYVLLDLDHWHAMERLCKTLPTTGKKPIRVMYPLNPNLVLKKSTPRFVFDSVTIAKVSVVPGVGRRDPSHARNVLGALFDYEPSKHKDWWLLGADCAGSMLDRLNAELTSPVIHWTGTAWCADLPP